MRAGTAYRGGRINAKKGRPPLDPLKQIASSGFIGYVEEEEVVHKTDEPGVIWVDIERIHDNPYQHAEEINPDDFQALVDSIKADGFQGALNVSPLSGQEDRYFLTGGGHQRRDAARVAGLATLPVFVADAPTDRMVLALRVARENTTRVNTSIINLGHLYQQMIDEFKLTQEQIAQRIGKDRNHIKFALMAVRSPADIQAMLRQKPDSVRAMVYFRRLERARELAQQRGVLPINIALAYVLCQPFPTFPLIGPRALSETRTSFPALTIELTPEELRWLNLEL